MVRKYLTKNESGFSLIELLITVVIIGVLAAMGVPQYRRMVFKSRTGEAKVLLGAISTSESAFLAEYGTYGNHIKYMGVNFDAPQAYVGGFNLLTAALPACAGSAYFPVAGAVVGLPAAHAYYGTATAVAETMVGLTAVGGNCGALGAVGGATYTAFASGDVQNPATGCTAAAGADQCDIWTINETRTIVNTQAGAGIN